MIVRIEIRHSDGRPVTAADSIPWSSALRLTAVALNGRGDSIEGHMVTWGSSGAIAIEDGGGYLFRAVGVGTGTISATIEDKAAHVTIKTYLDASTQVWPWPDTSRMRVGMSRLLVVREIEQGTPMRVGGDVRWESSNPAVVSVDLLGLISASGEGEATVTAIVGGRRIEAKVFAFRYLAPLRFADVTLASGYTHLGSIDRACGLTTGGALYCWGLGDGNGLGSEEPSDRCMRVRISLGRFLGSAVTRCSAIPIPVRPDLRFASVRGAHLRICALSVDATAYCWGRGANPGVPTPVAGNLTFQSIDVAVGDIGRSSACGVTTSGPAYCWGDNEYGQLGIGSTTNSEAPVPVGGGLVFQRVRAGSTACGITDDGATYCWGANDVAQAGAPVGTDTKTPVRVPGDRRFVQVEPAGSLTCGLEDTGGVYCWGAVGRPATASPTAVAVSGGLRFTRLIEHSPCGVTADGTVYRWDAELLPTRVALPFSVRAYGHTNGFGYRNAAAAQCGGAVQYALGTDGLLYWWDDFPGRSSANFFFHSADTPDGLVVGSHTPVLVPGQE